MIYFLFYFSFALYYAHSKSRQSESRNLWLRRSVSTKTIPFPISAYILPRCQSEVMKISNISFSRVVPNFNRIQYQRTLVHLRHEGVLIINYLLLYDSVYKYNSIRFSALRKEIYMFLDWHLRIFTKNLL